MIPQGQYSTRAADRLKEYLLDELRTSKTDRKEKENEWERIHSAYRAKPEQADEDKNFPFMGSANLVIPIIATDVDTMFARFMGLLFEPESLFSVVPGMPEMIPVAPRIEEFLKWAQHNEINFQSPVGDWLLELLKLGTGVLKTRYNREVKRVYEWRELGQQTWQQQATILLKDAPSVHRVPLYDFFVPAGFREIVDMPWCAERINLTWRRFQNRVSAGIYQPTTKISEVHARSSGSQTESRLQELSGFKQSRGNKLEMYEFWVNWDIQEVGMDVALVCTLHPDSGEYVRLDFNPFFNQESPYDVARFMRDENNFYGYGLGHMGLDYQDEITAIHNQRLDSGTIANSQTFAVSKDETDISVDEPVYPAKIWKLSNVANIKPLDLGSGRGVAASIEMERETFSTYQRRTGITDYTYGNPNTSTAYGSAFANQQMSQNSSRRSGEVLREIRNALSGVGTKTLELYQQFNQRGKEFFALGAQDGMLVRQVLQFPLDLIRRGLRVSVTAIDASLSSDSRMRNNALMMQQLIQYYSQVFQALQIAGNPSMPPQIQQTALEMIRGASILMHRILDDANIQDADRMIPQIAGIVDAQREQLAGLAQLPSITGQLYNPDGSPIGGASGGPQGLGTSPRMAGNPGAAPGLPAFLLGQTQGGGGPPGVGQVPGGNQLAGSY